MFHADELSWPREQSVFAILRTRLKIPCLTSILHRNPDWSPKHKGYTQHCIPFPSVCAHTSAACHDDAQTLCYSAPTLAPIAVDYKTLYMHKRPVVFAHYVLFVWARGRAVGGGTVLQAWYREFDFRWGLQTFHWPNPSGWTMAPGSTQLLNRNEYQRSSVGGRGSQCLGMTLPTSCADSKPRDESKPAQGRL